MRVVTNAPTFTGTLTYGVLTAILNVRCTQNHILGYQFSNGATGAIGTLHGVTDVSLNLNKLLGGSILVTTDAAQIDSTVSFAQASELVRFVGNSGQVSVNAKVDSHYGLSATLVPLSLAGAGSSSVSATITYTYNPSVPTTPTPTPTPSATPTPTPEPTATPSATPTPTPEPTATPSATPTPTPEPTATPSATPTPTPDPTATPTATPEPSITPSPSATPGPSPTPVDGGAELRNMSTRFQVGTGDSASIGGFIIGGSTAEDILIRAVGPSLENFGLPAD